MLGRSTGRRGLVPTSDPLENRTEQTAVSMARPQRKDALVMGICDGV